MTTLVVVVAVLGVVLVRDTSLYGPALVNAGVVLLSAGWRGNVRARPPVIVDVLLVASVVLALALVLYGLLAT